ncbi:MAG: hypothetical protein HQL59_04465 [Magnetococcales bacterium]|nr:hypothetical protein [Magnetococcales bacterium]
MDFFNPERQKQVLPFLPNSTGYTVPLNLVGHPWPAQPVYQRAAKGDHRGANTSNFPHAASWTETT